MLIALRHFFSQPTSLLLGKAKTFLENKDDLVALKPSGEGDHLSNFLRQHLVEQVSPKLPCPFQLKHHIYFCFQICSSGTVQKEHAADGSQYGRFNESTVATIVTIVTLFTAASFLLGPILGLYFLRNPAAKLVIVVIFTAAFAIMMSLITNARRAEIFGATAA